jgi:N-acetyl sugar amidotransferase
MDTTDAEIRFYGDEGCNHCLEMKLSLGKDWFIDSTGSEILSKIIAGIKSAGIGKEYDSILGLSGGVDSSYLALKAFDWGLRPLVVHVDAGWNSELAVSNIQAILDFTSWDLHTQVINWNEMADLQRSYLKSGVANQDVPQDHAFFASLYKYAVDHEINYVINGGNIATEGIFPKSWHSAAMDARNLKAIQKKFGNLKLRKYPTVSFLEYYVKFPLVKGIRSIRPLNYFYYDKDAAIKELEARVGYRRYPRKHGESVFTRFFQEYYLVERFGIDKRIAHFSSQIVSGQMTRDEAIYQLNQPLYSQGELERDIDFLCRKLRLPREEFVRILNSKKRSGGDFPNWNSYYWTMKKLQKLLEFILRKKIGVFS